MKVLVLEFLQDQSNGPSQRRQRLPGLPSLLLDLLDRSLKLGFAIPSFLPVAMSRQCGNVLQ
jgi:hypothetical protein